MLRGGYGIFYEVESSGNRVNHNMVPYTLSETVFNDGTHTMANYFVGHPIGSAKRPRNIQLALKFSF